MNGRLLRWGCSLLAAACGPGSERRPPPPHGPVTPEKVAEVVPPPAVAVEDAVPKRLAPMTSSAPAATLGDAEKRQVRKSIAEGRRLSRAKKLDEALVAFEAALAINPGSSTAACEAGFAALRLGQLERAQRHLRTGVASARDNVKEAMCRYNLGLVAEKRGQKDGAAIHFRDSLKLRDNATVRARLARIDLGARCLPPEKILDFDQVQCGLPDDYWICGKDEDGALIGDYNVWLPRFSDPESLGEGGTLRVLLSEFNSDTRFRSDLVLERAGTFVLLAELGWDVATDIETRIENVTYRHVDLVPGGDLEVVVRVRSFIDDSMGDHLFYACEEKHPDSGDDFVDCWDKAQKDNGPRQEQTVHVCGEVDGRWACARAEQVPADQRSFEALFRCVP